MSVQIRPSTVADVDAIFAIRTQVAENHMSLSELEQLGITPQGVSQMLCAMRDAAPHIWVAQKGDDVVGFAMVDQDEASLFAAFILPCHEGQGLGRALVQQAENVLFLCHDRIWLETAELSRACGFYRHLGWRITSQLPGGDVRMEKARPATRHP